MSPCVLCGDICESISAAHGVSLLSIQASAQECQYCALLGASVAKFHSEDDANDLRLGWDLSRIDGLRVVVERTSTNSHISALDVLQAPGQTWLRRSDAEYDSTPVDISGDTASDAGLTRLSQWIDHCTTTHVSCNAADSGRSLPTRVLQVGTADDDTVRIYESAREPARYICLSHCWGTGSSFSTTKATLPTFRDRIEWHLLPKTFQDAITITRKLRVRYLWVDSLCIIQDSEEDWQLESARMASIYEQSYLTLAASKSAHSNEGCFATAPAEFKLQPVEAMSARALVRKTLTHSYGQSGLPLLDRGWVMQERLLSPRFMHFTSDELIWECMEQIACECGCIRTLWSRDGEALQAKNSLSPIHLGGLPRADLHNLWHELVCSYSALDLSFSRDKLPALSGAAKRMQMIRGGQYLGGLWEDSLVKDLLWSTPLPARRPSPWRAPSWSWASVEGHIQYGRFISVQPQISIILATCSPYGYDATGEVNRDGRLEVIGTIAKLPAAWSGDGKLLLAFDDRDSDVVLSIDSDSLISGRPLNDQSSLDLLRIATQRVSSYPQYCEVSMILLKSAEPRVFQRIGILRVYYDGSRPELDLYGEASSEGQSIVIV